MSGGKNRETLKKDADQPVALHLLSVVSHQMGKHDIAIGLINKALALSPDLPAAQNNLGVALYKFGELEQAVASYHQALTVNPNHAETYNLNLRE